MSTDKSESKTQREQIKTVDPEVEPELVGAHSALVSETCANPIPTDTGDSPRFEICGGEATHTLVFCYNGKLSEAAFCDDCGAPDEVDGYDRKWSGEVFDR